MKIINWFKKIFKIGTYNPVEKQPDVKVVEWTDENGVRHAKYTVYVGKMTLKEKEKAVADLHKSMNSYKEDIKFDDSIGELTINGSASIPYEKNYFFPVND